LENDCSRLVILHDTVDHRLKDALVAGVVDTVAEREVDGVVLSVANADIPKFAGAREVLAVLVEGDGHDTVGAVESFFNAVTVVYVNVDVEHSWVEAKKLDDAKNDVYCLLDR
jgi:hypothetical protein